MSSHPRYNQTNGRKTETRTTSRCKFRASLETSVVVTAAPGVVDTDLDFILVSTRQSVVRNEPQGSLRAGTRTASDRCYAAISPCSNQSMQQSIHAAINRCTN